MNSPKDPFNILSKQQPGPRPQPRPDHTFTPEERQSILTSLAGNNFTIHIEPGFVRLERMRPLAIRPEEFDIPIDLFYKLAAAALGHPHTHVVHQPPAAQQQGGANGHAPSR